MSILTWDTIQDRLIVCVQWGDGVADDDWDELGDSLMRSRAGGELLPVLIVTEGRGASNEQVRRMRARLHGKQRIVFMTRAAAAIEAAHALENPEVHVDVVKPGDFGQALESLQLPPSLLTPVVVTVARLSRDTRPRREVELPSHTWDVSPRRMQRLE